MMPVLVLVPFLAGAEPPSRAAPVHPVDLRGSIERGWDWTTRKTGRAWRDTEKGVGDLFGYDAEAVQTYGCTDPAFFIIGYEHQTTGERHLALKGVLHTPSPGFRASFGMTGVQAPQAHAILSVGQPVTPQYRQKPGNNRVKVEEHFNLPEEVGLFRVKVLGMRAAPYEFTCDISPPVMK